MKLRELIDLLEELEESSSPEQEVLIALQPRYPLTASVSEVTLIHGPDAGVWIAASDTAPGYRSPYAPKAAWDGGIVSDGEEP